jgi:NADPH:quinone reductase-like Zn-dependent oxidoreductase
MTPESSCYEFKVIVGSTATSVTDAVAGQVDAGELRVDVSATHPLSRTAEVHEQRAARRVRGKVVLTP